MFEIMKKIFLLVLASVLLASCNTSKSYVSSFQRFVDKTDQRSGQYTLQDWGHSVKQFKTYSVDKFKKNQTKLTTAQRSKVLKLDARYVGILLRENITGVKTLIQDVRSFMPNVVQEVLKELFIPESSGKSRKK
jgi:hypothetical protein